MKPLRLTVEGFTSFRESVTVDFSDLDLFALTGPTGVGKSSLIDAMVFALYGQVPRVGDDYRQLVSHGAERLSVLFEFVVGGQAYRIARVVRRAGASQQRMERLQTGGGTEPLADKVKEIRNEVERILGLDYDGFTRSVVLPQGQFDSFLKGEPKERRKILVALLNLGVYERMQQIANKRSSDARAQALFVRQHLERDYAGVSPAALEECRERQLSAEAAVTEAEALLERLGEAAAVAQSLRQERRDVAALAKDEATEDEIVARCEATVAGSSERRASLVSRLGLVTREIASASSDEARLGILASAAPVAQQLEQRTLRLVRLATEAHGRERSLREAEEQRTEAEAGLALLQAHLEDACRHEEAARAGRDTAQRADLAGTLRRGLLPGDRCPVCEQPVSHPPRVQESLLDAADAAVIAALEESKETAAALDAQRSLFTRLEGRVLGLRLEVAQAEQERQDLSVLTNGLRTELGQLGVGEKETEDPSSLVVRISAERKRLEGARATRQRLEAERVLAERELAGLESAVATAVAQGETARERQAALRSRREAAEARVIRLRDELLSLAALESPEAPQDEVDVVEGERARAQGALGAATGAAAAARHDADHMERSLARAEELQAERQSLEERAAVHRTLADHLKANELVAWIQEEALRRLADEGSRHLSLLSQGRYALRLGAGDADLGGKAEQEFFVVDRWNGDSTRSVRTLSGGETFLASLALALALADSLTELSSQGGEALESLFLDEGFGSLDSETLDTVVSALDALHGGQRMVGIVTHVRELAERLPARLEVKRQEGTSTAVVI